MTRTPPPSDWVAYVVVISTVVLMMIGKYLIAKGDEPVSDVIKEDIVEVENIVEDVIHDVENKIK
jgi:hypothetical protein